MPRLDSPHIRMRSLLSQSSYTWRGRGAICDVTRGRFPFHLLASSRVLSTLVNNGMLNLALYGTIKRRGNNYYFKKRVQGFSSRSFPTCWESARAEVAGVAGWAGLGRGRAGRDICPPRALRRFHASGRPDDLGPGGTTC